MVKSLASWWRHLSRWAKCRAVLAGVVVIAVVVAAATYLVTGDGITVVASLNPRYTYVTVFALVTLDGVVPIFPGETTLNAASTAAAQGVLDLPLVMLAGAVGAICGDSALFWLSRRFSRRMRPQVERARANSQVRKGLELMESSAPVLIIGGRYVPGMRFVVNATMGLSDIPYRRFLGWSALSGLLWSVYTCGLAYLIGTALGEFPLASVIVSGVITTVAIAIVFVTIRRRRPSDAAVTGTSDGS